MNNPAEMLEGLTLDGNWKVLSKVERGPKATGGCFSFGYIVESPRGNKGYLKALDYSKAIQSPDPANMLQSMTEAFNFERTLCEKCITIDKVVLYGC